MGVSAALLILFQVLWPKFRPRDDSKAVLLSFAGLSIGALVIAGPFVVYQQLFQNCSIVIWFFTFVLSPVQFKLIALWIFLLAFSIAIPLLFPALTNPKLVSACIRRKMYHLVILLVLWPGLAMEPNLSRLACGGALFLLLLAEFMKMNKIPLFKELDSFWSGFTDSKDSGPITLSHIYLLLGCALPFFISETRPNRISCYSGLLSVAVGDAFAAVVGRTIGRVYWPGPGNKRTLEGSFGFIVSQIALIFLLQSTNTVSLLGYSAGFNIELLCSFLFSIPIAFVAVVEAHCQHFDNIVLPAVSFILFRFLEIYIIY